MHVLRNFSLVRLRNTRAFSRNRLIITDEVKTALTESKPVVALESTIVTHGMPFPSNVECALEVENVVRSQGAIPATIAILNGTIKVGLSKRELELLGDVTHSKPIKTSRRDFGYVLSRRLNGGTTVAGTVAICKAVGITVFATGGIGGVHRGASETFDVSADLTELGRCNVAVVSSGVKSILDIPKTLEFLETQGVHVCTIASTKSFPAFYCSTSNYEAPYNVETPLEAAKIIQAHLDLDLKSGLLFAVPVPEQYSLDSQSINRVIEEALAKAHEAQISGKAITPFLLSEIAKMTSGNSLKTNIALIKNNAKVAAEISFHLTEMKNSYTENPPQNLQTFAGQGTSGKHPVIIGGSNLDCVARLDVDEIKLDGRIHVGRFDYSPGGVGRNICEALGKLGFPAYFVSAIGDDYQGEILLQQIPNLSRQSVAKLAGYNTAQCIVVLDSTGECSFLMGDMTIHKEISSKMVEKHEELIKAAPLVVMDGNLSIETMDKLLGITEKHNIPVIFEPTDIATACKPFTTTKWKSINYITPNLAELKAISRYLNFPTAFSPANQIEEAAFLAQLLARDINNVLVTMGPEGILIAHRENDAKISLRHYPAQRLDNIVNVSGAGDCFASGYIAAVLTSCKESVCVSVGFAAALEALQSQSPVPKRFFDKTHPAWQIEAPHVNLHLRNDFFNAV